MNTSKYVFSFFTYYVFFILSKLFKSKFNELHHPTFKCSHKDKTIYDNPIIQRKLPNEIFFYFTDLQAKIAIKTFYQNIDYDNRNVVHTVIIFRQVLKLFGL